MKYRTIKDVVEELRAAEAKLAKVREWAEDRTSSSLPDSAGNVERECGLEVRAILDGDEA